MRQPVRPRLLAWVGGAAILLAACSQSPAPSSILTEAPQPTESPPTVEPTAPPAPGLDEATPAPTSDPMRGFTELSCDDPFGDVALRFRISVWTETDFCKHSVPFTEIFSGGPPPDGIPAIDQPAFDTVEEADEWLGDDWPVMSFELDGDVRAYPLAVLIWHEIVNDVVSGMPVALTFCPLCNSTIAFDATLEDGTILKFGTTGNLRNSDLVMYDRQTKSWWQQFTGEAIVGELTGTVLEPLPSQIIAWSDFKTHHPEGKVLSNETGFSRPYGRNPYAGYDSVNGSPWFPVSADDDRLPPMERVVAFEIGGFDVAYPISFLSEVQVVNDEIVDKPIVVFWKPGTRSAFGNSHADIGSTGTFSRRLGDQVLTFRATEGGFEDLETGSRWNIFGEAIEGPLAGSGLEPVITGEHFWFAWASFKPDTEVRTPEA